jgi:hypothetical protein
MAYPKQPRGEDVQSEIRTKLPTPPEIGVPPLPGTNPSGGAPKIKPQVVTAPEVPSVKPFWQNSEARQPTRRVLYQPSPWKREDVSKLWQPAMDILGKILWQRYQGLPPEQRAKASWQRIAQNPQEAARTIFTRALMNRAQLAPVELDPLEKQGVQQSDNWKWFQSVTGGNR